VPTKGSKRLAKRALLDWVAKKVDGYPNVSIKNLSSRYDYISLSPFCLSMYVCVLVAAALPMGWRCVRSSTSTSRS
jgi:hypothetical protein